MLIGVIRDRDSTDSLLYLGDLGYAYVLVRFESLLTAPITG